MKKALIVSPYFDHLGGGERYMLSAGVALETLEYQVVFAWDDLAAISNLSSMLDLHLISPSLDPVVKKLYFSHNPLAMYFATKKYDLVVYLSDGSIPLLGGRCNLLHMQVPFRAVSGKTLKNKLKLQFIKHIIVNSQFTKRVIDSEYGSSSVVLYPPVVPVQETLPKENLILSVGRFEKSLNIKHQDILIEAFKQLASSNPGWSLMLAGGSSDPNWIKELESQIGHAPITLLPNINHDDLSKLYSRAKIYWHGAGYQVDELQNPELTEHFGITTVEALSAHCIALVVPRGGQKEIIQDERYHWQTIEELVAKTQREVDNLSSYTVDIGIYSLARFTSQLGSLL